MSLPSHLDQKLCFQRTLRSADVPEQKGPNGKTVCKWCLKPLGKRRRSFCSAECAEEVKVRIFSNYAAWKTLERDKHKCVKCGEYGYEVDHILPVVEGGGCCGLDNLRTLCTECHLEETRALRKRMARKRKEDRQQAALDRLKEMDSA